MAFILIGGILVFVYDIQVEPSVEPVNVAFLEAFETAMHEIELEDGLKVSFSENTFLNTTDLRVHIYSNNPNATIFFTLDGSVPTIDSHIYTATTNVLFDIRVNPYVAVLRAIAVYDDEISPVNTQSFFMGANANERFSTYVISLTIDDYLLFNYYDGLFVDGVTRSEWHRDWIYESPERAERPIPAWAPANWTQRGREWERPVHVEIFTMYGERVIAQNAGYRIHGQTSRRRSERGFRLYARRYYEPTMGRFHYNFFEGDFTNVHGRVINSYDTLVLLNDGQDFNGARVRRQFALTIAREAGFLSTPPPTRATVVFINGRFYGFRHLNVRINGHYLQDLFDTPTRDFEVVCFSYLYLHRDAPDELVQIVYYARQGFTDDTLQLFHELFCIYDFMRYYALNMFIENKDWPSANTEVWRYLGENTQNNPYLDGRWRFRVWDLDHIMGRYDHPNAENIIPHSESQIRRILDLDHYPLFRELMKIPEYAEIFANMAMDLAHEHFSIENSTRVMQELDALVIQEFKYLSIWDSVYYHEYTGRRAMLEWIEVRPYYFIQDMREELGFTETFQIMSDGTVNINRLNGNHGTYFIEHSVPVSPRLGRGQVFSYWVVNDEIYYEENIRISVADANHEGIVFIRAVIVDTPPPLMFVDTFDEGNFSWFTMTNLRGSTQNTSGLFLSNNINNLQRWELPGFNISPEVTWRFVSRDSRAIDTLFDIRLNFNPRRGEVIYLSDSYGNILDQITVT